MEARLVTRIESAVDLSAATALALAGAASATWLGYSPAVAALAGLAAGLVGWKILSAVQVEPQTFGLAFEPSSLPEAEGPAELVLTDADRYEPAAHAPVAEADEALVLDDVLARLDDGSRVVRLFDPAAMPTPGQLQSRIDRHLASPGSSGAVPDATRELHDALAELRRTLR
jgi:hypothetical protein